ncbi:MAG: toluene tolerance protein [Hyphomonas sp. BRH_c22]|uniref:MlaC/ttg2D family ABC transporter substrate-binding protein n=1 Tax=Hyphomonas sp. BRH_c22 TaxID=1629710 RepID=UPI0005F1AC97|nr:ABC transporter substrate-binding protein [Hyphomonas sp. BRH_c22]KJS38315.1 MAG: toluene tolerance protein [Hyphomonas sp. BRH_c22]
MRRFKNLCLVFVAVCLNATPADADARTEIFVQKNASEVLQSLNDPRLSPLQRATVFSESMDGFTDLDAVSNFTIGKYARRFSQEDLHRYRRAFRAYAMTFYETELGAYRGETVIVKDSIDRSESDSIVNTVIKRNDGKDMDVRWRVQGSDGKYQVVDVALNRDGNLIWLAIEQRAQFLALLDKSNGSAEALIDRVESMTAELKSKIRD